MSHIEQSRGFEERLKDFGPELGPFLKAVWNDRANLRNKKDAEARRRIYAMYSGNARIEPFDEATLTDFIARLRTLGSVTAGCEIHCQGMTPKNLDDYDDTAIDVQCHDLWTTFFHVIDMQARSHADTTTARVYVHAINWQSSLEIMRVIVERFRKGGPWEVKTAGPGQKRLDTIVGYFYDGASRDAIVQLLLEEQRRHSGWFADGLPPLVKQLGRGIGVADEPPQIRIVPRGERRHSFGSFYATIAWLALKTTPNLMVPEKEDPRHFLDNVLYSLRLLKVNPADPQQFPAKDVLEAWYRRAKSPGGART